MKGPKTMHYNVNYEGLDEISKYNKAIADIKDYLGDAKFDQITKEFMRFDQKDMPLEKFECYISLAGIQGYPVKALYNYCYSL